jgi:hypothetical protein
MTETRSTVPGTFKSGTDTALGLLKDRSETTVPARKHVCSAKVMRQLSWHQSPCSRPAAVERDGVWWCKQHDPEAKKRRDEARQARYDAQWNADSERWHVQRYGGPAIELLRTIANGLSDARGAAERFMVAFEADRPARRGTESSTSGSLPTVAAESDPLVTLQNQHD